MYAVVETDNVRTMKVSYDKKVDVLRVLFSDRQIVDSDEVSPGLIVDYAGDGSVVGIEVLDAKRVVNDPQSVELRAA
jgi:uncharacterized protein YuzE